MMRGALPNAVVATRRGLSVVTAAVALVAAAVSIAATGQSFSDLSRPVLFDTPEADAILAGLPVFPRDNPWNQDISSLPGHGEGDALSAGVRSGSIPDSFERAD